MARNGLLDFKSQAMQVQYRIMDRIAPAPVSSGISRRVLPAASFQQLSATCDHWLAKGSGYEGPASRCLFDLASEIKVPHSKCCVIAA